MAVYEEQGPMTDEMMLEHLKMATASLEAKIENGRAERSKPPSLKSLVVEFQRREAGLGVNPSIEYGRAVDGRVVSILRALDEKVIPRLKRMRDGGGTLAAQMLRDLDEDVA